jgi:hypothetical protein
LHSLILPSLSYAYLLNYSFSLWMFFCTSSWWNFLNPFNLGFDPLGAGSIFACFCLFPGVLFCAGRACKASPDDAPLKILASPFLTTALYPPLLVLLSLISPLAANARTILSLAAVSSSFNGHVRLLLFTPNSSLFPFSAMLGLAIFQSLLTAFGSKNVLMEYSAGTEASDVPLIVVGAVLNVACGYYLFHKSSPSSSYSPARLDSADAEAVLISEDGKEDAESPKPFARTGVAAVALSTTIMLTVQYVRAKRAQRGVRPPERIICNRSGLQGVSRGGVRGESEETGGGVS